jgi:hypothetical protein
VAVTRACRQPRRRVKKKKRARTVAVPAAADDLLTKSRCVRPTLPTSASPVALASGTCLLATRRDGWDGNGMSPNRGRDPISSPAVAVGLICHVTRLAPESHGLDHAGLVARRHAAPARPGPWSLVTTPQQQPDEPGH